MFLRINQSLTHSIYLYISIATDYATNYLKRDQLPQSRPISRHTSTYVNIYRQEPSIALVPITNTCH